MRFIKILQLAFISFSLSLLTYSQLSQADYAQVNGVELYYEIHGSGTPLVMLHGGYVDSDMWRIETAILAKHFQVIEIDSRGHGRSTDGTEAITYELMTNDTLTLLDQLNIDNAHFVGWSDGAVIAAEVAAYYPERVNKLVLIGAAFGGDTYVSAFSSVLNSELIFTTFANLTFGLKYKAVNPTPEHWPVFRDKLYDLWKTPCYLPTTPGQHCLAPLANINSDTLVMVGKNEIIEFAHTEEIVAEIAGAELEVVALAGHFLPEIRPFKTANLILDFIQ
jgi:pimeloyl-ACP methyl ester carboxylesterase